MEHFQKKSKWFVIILKLFLIESLAQKRIKVFILSMWDVRHRRDCMEWAVVFVLEWHRFPDFFFFPFSGLPPWYDLKRGSYKKLRNQVDTSANRFIFKNVT